MRDEVLALLRFNLEQSLKAINNEIKQEPPENIHEICGRAIDAAIKVASATPSFGTPPTDLKRIDLSDGVDKATSTKPHNFSVNILDWLNIGWKAAGTAAAIHTFGAWTAIGLILVVRDILRLFTVKLSMVHGQILHVLAKDSKAGGESLSIVELAARVNSTYGTTYSLVQIQDRLEELDRMKCIKLDETTDSITLIETVTF